MAPTGAASTAMRGYPTEFVKALTEAGWVRQSSSRRRWRRGPRHRRRARCWRRSTRPACNAAACHAQMYIMGTALRRTASRSRRSATCSLRSPAASCACRLSASPSQTQRHRYAQPAGRHGGEEEQQHLLFVNGEKVWTSRAEHSDLMSAARPHHAEEQTEKRTEGLSVFLVDMRAALRQGPDDQADPHDDEP